MKEKMSNNVIVKFHTGEGRSLYLFKSDSLIRILITKFVKSQHFEMFIFMLIFV